MYLLRRSSGIAFHAPRLLQERMLGGSGHIWFRSGFGKTTLVTIAVFACIVAASLLTMFQYLHNVRTTSDI